MKISLCLLACALLCPAVALATSPFTYDYAELSYQHQTPQDGASAKGPGVDIAYTVFPALQVLGGYARLNAATPISSTIYDDYFAGIRGESNYDDVTDFYTDILYLNNHSRYLGAGRTDNGYRVALGMRHLITPWLEFDGSIGHNWLDQSSNDATIGLLVNATGQFAVGANYSHSSVTNNTVGLLFRLYF